MVKPDWTTLDRRLAWPMDGYRVSDILAALIAWGQKGKTEVSETREQVTCPICGQVTVIHNFSAPEPRRRTEKGCGHFLALLGDHKVRFGFEVATERKEGNENELAPEATATAGG